MTLPKSPVGCPLDSLLRLLMGPWTTYILWVLTSNGPTRFGELKRKVPGISAKVLTERLRMLQDADVVLRDFQPTIPPQVTYSLTARGLELHEVLQALNAIAQRWRAADAVRANGHDTATGEGRPAREPAPVVASPTTVG
jgi:DNA-binding HxlR family transcriptional regulator